MVSFFYSSQTPSIRISCCNIEQYMAIRWQPFCTTHTHTHIYTNQHSHKAVLLASKESASTHRHCILKATSWELLWCMVCCLVKKLMLSLSVPRRHKRGVKVQTYSFLTSALGEISGQLHSRLPKSGTNPRTHWIGSSVGSKSSLDVLEKRKISWLCQDLNLGSSSPCLVTRPTMLLCSFTLYEAFNLLI